jgi:hypothetical protein
LTEPQTSKRATELGAGRWRPGSAARAYPVMNHPAGTLVTPVTVGRVADLPPGDP